MVMGPTGPAHPTWLSLSPAPRAPGGTLPTEAQFRCCCLQEAFTATAGTESRVCCLLFGGALGRTLSRLPSCGH